MSPLTSFSRDDEDLTIKWFLCPLQKRKGEGDNAAGPATENRGPPPPHRTTTELSNMAANIAADRRGGQTQQTATAETAVAMAADNNGDGGDFRNVQGGRSSERLTKFLLDSSREPSGCMNELSSDKILKNE